MYSCVWYFCICLFVYAVFFITNNRHDVTITTHAIKRHFLIWMTTVRQPTKHRCSCVLTLKYTFICVYWWTRQRIHNTLIAVDRYLRLMGYKTIPDSAEPRLESFYPPFVAGIDLPHQGVVDSYNLGHTVFISHDQVSCTRQDGLPTLSLISWVPHDLKDGFYIPTGPWYWKDSLSSEYIIYFFPLACGGGNTAQNSYLFTRLYWRIRCITVLVDINWTSSRHKLLKKDPRSSSKRIF